MLASHWIFYPAKVLRFCLISPQPLLVQQTCPSLWVPLPSQLSRDLHQANRDPPRAPDHPTALSTTTYTACRTPAYGTGEALSPSPAWLEDNAKTLLSAEIPLGLCWDSPARREELEARAPCCPALAGPGLQAWLALQLLGTTRSKNTRKLEALQANFLVLSQRN